MRKIGFILAMLVSTLFAHAGEYAYLVFVNQNNDSTALSVVNMTLSVDANSLTVTNADKTEVFTLTDLSLMQFMTADGQMALALDNMLNADAPIDAYTITGIHAGHFNSLREAVRQLSKGCYVITNGKNFQKILLQ